jgi:hypothetical protein
LYCSLPRCLRLFSLAFVVWLGSTGAVVADESSMEFWPEIDLWLRVSPSWRLSAFIATSKNIETAYREGSLVFQGDYAWGKETLLHQTRLVDEDRAQELKALLVRSG